MLVNASATKTFKRCVQSKMYTSHQMLSAPKVCVY